jgi:citrate synthase
MSTVSGLEGVVVAETKLSEVDGERGVLVLAGHDVEQLAGSITFEQCAALFGHGALGAARVRAFARIRALGDALERDDGMDALRASVAHLPGTSSAEDLIGAVSVYAAAWARRGKPPIAPDPSLSHAADYLRMIDGDAPSQPRVDALNAYLVTVSDHGMNASTFAARVVASTGSDLTSSIVAAIGALKGPLHGGAPGPVLDMLDAIGKPERAVEWLEQELSSGRRIMGMGHRIYRVRDPRAAVLEKAIERFEKHGTSTERLTLARAVERAALGILRTRYPNRPLHANVEFYTAVILDAVGLHRSVFTPTFAVGRVVGWAAHVAEQRATGRLIRPASKYVGAMPSEVRA